MTEVCYFISHHLYIIFGPFTNYETSLKNASEEARILHFFLKMGDDTLFYMTLSANLLIFPDDF